MHKSQLWGIRAFICRYFAEMTHPPRVEKTASHSALTYEEAVSAYEQVQEIFKELGLSSEFWRAQ
jgi:predicted ATPase